MNVVIKVSIGSRGDLVRPPWPEGLVQIGSICRTVHRWTKSGGHLAELGSKNPAEETAGRDGIFELDNSCELSVFDMAIRRKQCPVRPKVWILSAASDVTVTELGVFSRTVRLDYA